VEFFLASRFGRKALNGKLTRRQKSLQDVAPHRRPEKKIQRGIELVMLARLKKLPACKDERRNSTARFGQSQTAARETVISRAASL
jgi:hypothetical protein